MMDHKPTADHGSADITHHTLVPSTDGIAVAIDASPRAIVQRILELANDVHENVHIYSRLLYDLLPAGEVVEREIGIAIREFGGRCSERRFDVLVGVVVRAVVVVKVLEVGVGASRAADAHFVLSIVSLGKASSVVSISNISRGGEYEKSTHDKKDGSANIEQKSGHIKWDS